MYGRKKVQFRINAVGLKFNRLHFGLIDNEGSANYGDGDEEDDDDDQDDGR